MIKAVIFDFFGVIRSDDFWRFLKRDRGADIIFNEYAQEVNRGDMRWKVFVQHVAKVSGHSVQEVNDMYAAEQIDPLMVGLIHDLHLSYKTGLLTNASHEFIEPLLQEYHLRELFDAVVVSSKFGIVKPDPRIFERVLQELQVKASEAVYVDDLKRHVEGAEALGMKAIWHRNYPQTKEQLSAILDKPV